MRKSQQHFFVLLLALAGLIILSGCSSQPEVGRSPSGDMTTDITDKITAQSQKPPDTAGQRSGQRGLPPIFRYLQPTLEMS